ncbi:MAG: glucuronate isomerase [Clostridia bacterium]|nr:glucuronate isomerase [Clostridia bacterium]
MRDNYLLRSPLAVSLYERAKDLPIYDYHCHLNPKEIWEDRPFDNIGEIWLGGDHYKWRMMRGAGIPEEQITGSASYHDKFVAYASALPGAVGNPLALWSQVELETCFGIDLTLNAQNAEEIWTRANAYIQKTQMSPRKLIKQFGVAFIGTTDDPCDSLEYHRLLAEDKSFDVAVTPSFRTDNLLCATRAGYTDYIAKLSAASGVAITSLSTLLEAVEKRITFFKAHGCVFTDVGITDFPNRIADSEEADQTFRRVLAGGAVDHDAYMGFLGRMFLELGKLYRKHRLVMQLHLAAYRNPNSGLFATLGADCGCDCIGRAVDGADLIRVLDAIDREGGLPETILYCLNPAMNDQLASIAGSFRGVKLGAAWWFNDHRFGIVQVLNSLCSIGYLGAFYGMLTDSRSFLSYPRHDFFRRLLCSFVADLYENGEVPDAAALPEVVENICYTNIMNRIGECK